MGEMANSLTELVKRNYSLEEIVKEKNLPLEHVIKFLSDNYDNLEVKNFLTNYYDKFKIDDYKAIVISDTHLGGKYGNYRLVNSVYNFALKNNFKYIIHVGDVIEGFVNRTITSPPIEVQIYELLTKYPECDEIITYYLMGNHDYFFVGPLDANLLRTNFDTMKNIICIGVLKSYIKFQNHRLSVYHSDQYGLRIPPLNYDLRLQGHSHIYNFYEEEHTIKLPALCLGENHSISSTGFIALYLSNDNYVFQKYNFDFNYNPFLKEEVKILTKK